MDFAIEEMRKQGHDVEVLYYENSPLQFKYNNIIHKTTSGIGKLFGLNAKKEAREKALKKRFKNQKFDFTLMIHGQYLNHATHQFLKSISKKYVAYFFDSLAKMPEQKTIAQHFDTVFSYEPIDCETEGYRFITNFIPTEKYRSNHFDYDVFNISAHDHRLPTLKKLAHTFAEQKVTFKFILYSKKIDALEHFEITNKKIDFQEIGALLQKTKCIVDIQRNEQKGLSFRPFEALGNEKKLITNNPEIQKYSFFNPNNILIINTSNFSVPKDFFDSPYQEIPGKIYDAFTVESWVKQILV